MATTTRTIFLKGPDPTLKLAPNDVWLPGIYSRRILCFHLPTQTTHDQVLEIFTQALQSLVKSIPELGATSIITNPDTNPSSLQLPWRALVPGEKGIELVIKDLTKSFRTFRELEDAGFPIGEFKDQVLMPIDGPIMPEPASVAKFQLSFIEGGVLFSLCFLHHFSDGNGMNAIMRVLAEECVRGGGGDSTTLELSPRVLDTSRKVFENLGEGRRNLEDHPAYDIVEGIFTPGAEHHDEDEHPTTPLQFKPKYFFLSNEKAEALKVYGSTHSPVSTHDSISAALWRNLIISRHRTGELTSLSQLSTFTIPHNARKYLHLPESWVGNLTYFIIAQATISEILHPDSLPLLAGRIRAALQNVTKEHVEGVMQIRRENPYGLNWWPLWKCGDGEVVALTSFYHSDLLGYDWGEKLGGRARHFTTTDVGGIAEGLQRVHYVGPRVEGGKGCWVFAGILEGEAEFFEGEEVWGRFFEGGWKG